MTKRDLTWLQCGVPMKLDNQNQCEAPRSCFEPQSVWTSDALHRRNTADVCVIGAGVSGLCVALELAQRGLQVVVIERGDLRHGESARSTAHLVTALDERYFVLEQRFGAQIARAAASCHAAAIDWIARNVQRHDIACELQSMNGYLVVPPDATPRAQPLLGREHAAATRAGIACEIVNLPVELFTTASPALVFPGQATLNPVAFLTGLAHAIQSLGGRVVSGRAVVDVTPGLINDVHCSDGTLVQARHVVLATRGIPPRHQSNVRSIRPIVTYAVAYELASPTVISQPALLWDGFWDSPRPYHYVRIDAAQGGHAVRQPRVIVGGEDHDGHCDHDAPQRFAKIDQWAREMIRGLGQPQCRWWGRIGEPQREFALIGRAPGCEQVYLIAGDSGNGMTYAAIAARRLADMVEGKPTLQIEDEMFNPRC